MWRLICIPRGYHLVVKFQYPESLVNPLLQETCVKDNVPKGVFVFLILLKILVSARFCGVCAR